MYSRERKSRERRRKESGKPVGGEGDEMRRRCPPLHRRRRIFWDPDRFGVIDAGGQCGTCPVELHAKFGRKGYWTMAPATVSSALLVTQRSAHWTGIDGKEDEKGRDKTMEEVDHRGGQGLSPQPHAIATVQLEPVATPLSGSQDLSGEKRHTRGNPYLHSLRGWQSHG